MADETPTQTIVFFDGVCHLCNASIDFLASHDPQRKLRFAPLQGSTAARLLPVELRKDLQSLVVWRQGSVLLKSTGVLNALKEVGGAWKFLGILGMIFPKFMRDGIYDLIARNRYSWFGKSETCRIPTKEEREQILD